MMHAPYCPPSDRLTYHELHRDRTLFWITFGVLIAHAAALWFSSTSPSPLPIKQQKVVVKTVQLHPRTLNPVTVPSQATPQVIPEKKLETIPQAIPAPRLETPPEPPLPIKTQEPPSPLAEAPKVQAAPEPVKESPPKTTPKTTAKKEPVKKPAPKAPKATKTPKKEAEAPVKKAATETKPKTPPKPTAEEIAAKKAEEARQKELAAAKVKQQELLAKAKQDFSKIGETREKMTTTKIASLEGTTIPKQLENLQIDALPVGATSPVELSVKEANYRDEVGSRLQQALRLPDHKAVKVKLTLNRSGKVVDFSIETESEKNRQYIERSLPSLIFPPFGNRFEEASEYTFSVNLVT